MQEMFGDAPANGTFRFDKDSLNNHQFADNLVNRLQNYFGPAITTHLLQVTVANEVPPLPQVEKKKHAKMTDHFDVNEFEDGRGDSKLSLFMVNIKINAQFQASIVVHFQMQQWFP